MWLTSGHSEHTPKVKGERLAETTYDFSQILLGKGFKVLFLKLWHANTDSKLKDFNYYVIYWVV